MGEYDNKNNRLDITVVEKKTVKFQMVDLLCTFDIRVKKKRG